MQFDMVSVVLTYLCVMLGAAAAVLIHHWFAEWRHPWRLSEESLLQCPECHYAFIVRRRSQTGRCPRCNRLCQVRTKK